jgi:hypothetical protein
MLLSRAGCVKESITEIRDNQYNDGFSAKEGKLRRRNRMQKANESGFSARSNENQYK